MSRGISGVTPDELAAEFTDFDPTAKSYRSTSTDVDKALQEIRLLKVYDPVDTDTTLNGNLTLDNTDNTLQVIHGTATGYSVQLPDATTIAEGTSYIIVNESDESLNVKDGAGTILLTLNTGDLVECILEHDTTAEGTWITVITSATANGITSYVVTSDVLFSTSSATDDLITGFTVTPVSGRYAVWYSAEIIISTNNRSAECVVFKDGTAVENTRRKTQGIGSDFESSQQTIGEITVNGSEAVDIRVNIDVGSLDVEQRSLVLIRLGGA